MRAPLKYLAPLILLPFLACTDTPAEPEKEETTALFRPDQPQEPGDWLVVDMQCSGDYIGYVVAGAEEFYYAVSCWPRSLDWPIGIPCREEMGFPTFIEMPDNDFAAAYHVWTKPRPQKETIKVCGWGIEGLTEDDLPITSHCFVPDGDRLRSVCEATVYEVTID